MANLESDLIVVGQKLAINRCGGASAQPAVKSKMTEPTQKKTRIEMKSTTDAEEETISVIATSLYSKM